MSDKSFDHLDVEAVDGNKYLNDDSASIYHEALEEVKLRIFHKKFLFWATVSASGLITLIGLVFIALFAFGCIRVDRYVAIASIAALMIHPLFLFRLLVASVWSSQTLNKKSEDNQEI